MTGSFASVTFRDTEAPISLDDGFVVFDEGDPGCVALPHAPCTLALDGLSWRFADFTKGDLRFEDLRVVLQQPIVVLDHGGGYRVPTSAETSACARINGTLRMAEEVRHSAFSLMVTPSRQDLTFDGVVNLRFSFRETDLSAGAILAPIRIDLQFNVFAVGDQPWIGGWSQ